MFKGHPREMIYLIKVNTLYKIGRTSNLRKRLEAYVTHCPNMEEIMAIEVYDAKGVEKALHKLLVRYRKHGEWFELPESIVDSVRNLCKGLGS